MIVLGAMAFGHFIVRNVGNLAEQTHHFLLGFVHLTLQLLRVFLQGCHSLLDGFGFLFLAFLHQAANLT